MEVLDKSKMFTRYSKGDKDNNKCYIFNESVKVMLDSSKRGLISLKVGNSKKYCDIKKSEFNLFGFIEFCRQVYFKRYDIVETFGEEIVLDID